LVIDKRQENGGRVLQKIDDRYLPDVLSLAHHWMTAEEPRRILGSDMIFRPQMVTYTYESLAEDIIIAANEGLQRGSDNYHRMNGDARVVMAVGDPPNQGEGLIIEQSHLGTCEDSESSQEGIATLINDLDKVSDVTWKEGLERYFMAHGTISREKSDSEFFRLAYVPPIIDLQQPTRNTFDPERIVGVTLEQIKHLKIGEIIGSSEIYFNRSLKTMRLVRIERIGSGFETSIIRQCQELWRVVIEAKTANKEGREVTLYQSFGGSDLTEDVMLQQTIQLVQKMSEDVENFYNSEQQNSYFGPMVFSGAAAATLIHETHTGHLISGRYNTEADATVYSALENQKVLPSHITIIDDPTMPGGFGSYKYDDEGVLGEPTVVVENGIMRALLHDRLSAGHMNKEKSNGHARSSNCQPFEPRMSNLIVRSTQGCSKEELIEKMKEEVVARGLDYGLYIESATQGEVEPDSGNVRIMPSKAWRVYPNSTIWQPVSGFYLICEPLQTLNSIEAMGTEIESDIGGCGAKSGTVTVQHNCVPIYVKGLEGRKATGHPDRERVLPFMRSVNGNGDHDDGHDDE